MYPNVVISKWTTRRGAGWQVEKEYVERLGKQFECNYFNKQCNVVPQRYRFKPKKKFLPSSYSTVTTVHNSPDKKAKWKGKTKAKMKAKAKIKAKVKAATTSHLARGKKPCKGIEERELEGDQEIVEGDTISGMKDHVVKKTGEGIDDDDQI